MARPGFEEAKASIVFEPVGGDALDTAAEVERVLRELYAQHGWSPLISAPIAFPEILCLAGNVFLDFDFVDEPGKFESLALSLANQLSRAGWSGQLVPGRPVSPSRAVPLDKVNGMSVGLALSYALIGNPHDNWRRESRRWHTSDVLTDRVVAAALEWTTPTFSETYYVQVGRHTAPASPAEAERTIRYQLSAFPHMSIFAFTESGFRRVILNGLGHVVFEVGGCNEEWRDTLTSLTDLLRAWADVTRYGLIRRTIAPGFAWPPSDNIMPSPEVYPNYYLDAPALEDEWVPDPHGVQIVTTRHLERLSLGASWIVEPLLQDKYLVHAEPLDSWFDLGRPLESTLAQARQEFNNVLLTTDIATASRPRA
jgi:hypothetical protein